MPTKESPGTYILDCEIAPKESKPQRIKRFIQQLGFEVQGISPTPLEARTDRRLYQLSFMFFSANFNLLAFSTGTAGPVLYDLGLRDSLLTILIADVTSCALPCAIATFGPKLGLRGMVQARFSWGYYGSRIPSLLNVFSMQGYLILSTIIASQALAGVSKGLSQSWSITIIALLTFIVTLFGYKVVHWFESLAWIPNILAFIVMLAVGGKHLTPSGMPVHPPSSASSVLSFGTLVAAWVLSWCSLTPDYGIHHDAKASSLKVFLFSYLGLFSSSITWHMLGAAIASAAPAVPSWNSGFGPNKNDLGGLVSAILAPIGVFGKIVGVLMALSTASGCLPAMYTFGTSFMAVSDVFERVPQYCFPILATAILIPVGIVGSTRFYATLTNVLGLVGYWVAPFAVIVLTDHFIIRRGDYSSYNVEDWNKPQKLPTNAPAVVAFFASVAIIIPCMSQPWFPGPIATAGAGDISIITGTAVATVFYLTFRMLEKIWRR